MPARRSRFCTLPYGLHLSRWSAFHCSESAWRRLGLGFENSGCTPLIYPVIQARYSECSGTFGKLNRATTCQSSAVLKIFLPYVQPIMKTVPARTQIYTDMDGQFKSSSPQYKPLRRPEKCCSIARTREESCESISTLKLSQYYQGRLLPRPKTKSKLLSSLRKLFEPYNQLLVPSQDPASVQVMVHLIFCMFR